MTSHSRRRFLAGLSAGSALAASRLAAGQSERGYPRLLQGPMIGATGPDRALIWARLSGEFEAVLDIAEAGAAPAWRSTAAQTAQAAQDLTLQLSANGLEPEQDYLYRIRVEGEAPKYLEGRTFRFRTAPAGPSRFRLAFGSCARIQEHPRQPIWQAVRAWRPDLFFWLGDNVYGDSLHGEVLAGEYRRQRGVRELQTLLPELPQLAIWDDHDFGLNNHDRRNPIKQPALAIFKRYWANPAYGTAETAGVFFRYSYGGVDFFCLDGRYHRSPNTDPDGPDKTMLGAAQLSWLKRELKASTAPFKLLLCGSGWTKAKGMGGDSWASFVHERDRLFDFIRDETISGVVLLSGDTHVAELNCIPRSEQGGYDLYDLVSSPLAQDASGSWRRRSPELRIRPVYAGGPNFGLIDFDLTADDPSLSFTAIQPSGQPVWRPLTLHASELVNGVESWQEKRSPQ